MKWINAGGKDVTLETLSALKKVMGDGQGLAKAATITTDQGLVAYDLEAPAKNLYPVLTPLRNRIPRTTRGSGAGTGAHWKEVTSIAAGGIRSMAFVPEGQRAPRMTMQTADRSASYVTLGVETDVTFEAQSAGEGFEDTMASAGMRLLQAMMIMEEYAILGANRTLVMTRPGTPTVVSASTGGTVAAGTYLVHCVALTLEGLLAASLTTGVIQSQTIVGMDGQSYTLQGGSSRPSVAGTTGAVTGDTNSFTASVPAVKGAVAYAWYIGATGAIKMEYITTINSVAVTSLAGTGALFSALADTDHSNNAELAFNGLLYSAMGSDLAYYKAMPTGVAGVGTGLTGSGRGSINEIDVMLEAFWNNYRIAPEELYVGAQELRNITGKVLTGSGTPMIRFNFDINAQNPTIVAGQVVGYYFNPFSMAGGSLLPIQLHPNLPAGTIFAWAQNLPAHYQAANVPQVATMQCRRDYYQIPWPLVTRANQTGVYAEEVLKVYAPFALGVITNISNS